MKHILILLLIFTALNAKLFQGNIGKYKVAMYIGETEKYYSYKGKLLQNNLRGNYNKLCEYTKLDDDENPIITACFKGTLHEGIYSGKWQKIGSKEYLDFKLKEIKVKKDKDDNNEMLKYISIIKKDIKFKKLKKYKTQKGLKTIAYIEPITKVIRDRVILKNKTVEAKINRYLEKLHKQSVVEEVFYILDDIESDIKESSSNLKVEYFKYPFLTVSYYNAYYGGAHPTYSFDQYLFSLKNGEIIDLESMFKLYIDKDNLKNKEFGEILKKYLNKEMSDCNKDPNQHYEIYPTNKGKLAIYTTGLGSMLHYCEEEPIALIPIKELKKVAKRSAYEYFDFEKSKIKAKWWVENIKKIAFYYYCFICLL